MTGSTLRVERDVALAARTTLGLGGPARRLARVTTEAELVEALAESQLAGDPVLVLGGGSNLVVHDGGWDGLVVQLAIEGVTIDLRADHALVTAAAGVPWDAFVAQMVGAGLAGVECLSGIPGLVGATPIQNVGAYGQEVAETIAAVRVYDRETARFETLAPDACGFAYRASRFKGHDRWIVVAVTFRLARDPLGAPVRYPELARALGAGDGQRAPLGQLRDTVIRLRRGKGMVIDPADPDSRSAGSFFVNPIVDPGAIAALRARVGAEVAIPMFDAPGGRTKLSAGWLIERAGFGKGLRRGHVGISSKHALALVHHGGGTTTQLLALAREIQDGVRARLGIELVPEPVIVGTPSVTGPRDGGS